MTPILSTQEKGYVLLWATGVATALLLVPHLPSDFVQQVLWSVRHMADFPLAIRVALALAGFLICIPRFHRKLWTGIRLLTPKIPEQCHSKRARRLLYPLIGGLSLPLFYLLRNRNYALGDSAHLIQVITFYGHTTGYHITYDEPMELYVHSIAYRILHRAFDWDAARSYALISALCGVAFVYILLALSKQFSQDPAKRWTVFGLVLSMGTIQLFFGHVENYTIVATGVLLYILLAIHYLKGRCSIVWPSLALSLSFCMHVLAGWLFPSLLYLWAVKARAHGLRKNILSFGAMSAAVLLPIGLTIAYCTYLGVGPEYMKGTHLARMKFIFLLNESFPYYQYPMFSFRHLTDVLNELVLTSLPGIMILGFVGLFHVRNVDFKDPFLRFLIIATAFLQLFAISWNPDLGAYRDWDLYAIIGIGYLPLGAYLLVRFVPDVRKVRYAGLVFVVLALIHTGTWVVSNARKHVPVDSTHDAAHLWLGNRSIQEGRPNKAIENYKEAIRINPYSATAHFNLAKAYLMKADSARAWTHLQDALRLAPNPQYARRIRQMIEQLKKGQDPAP